MTLLLNSGAEAVENAVKVARYATGRPAVIAFDNGFHGRTYMAMSLTSKVKPYKFGFGPFAPEIYRMPYAYCYRCPFGLTYPACGTACADYLEEFFITHVAAESTAAVIAEPIQGEGGFITPPPEYFPKLKSICEKYGIALIIDEVQSGSGRTGKFFAIEHWGVAPDIITLAKSFAGGMPLSAVIGREDMMSKPHVGGLGGTYGGNPVSCRAALAVLEILCDDGLMAQGVALGDTLLSRLNSLKDQLRNHRRRPRQGRHAGHGAGKRPPDQGPGHGPGQGPDPALFRKGAGDPFLRQFRQRDPDPDAPGHHRRAAGKRAGNFRRELEGDHRMKGFFSRILNIDLSNRTSAVEQIDDALLSSTLGGKGLATRLLLEKNPVGVDPFDPENRFIVALGPATNSGIYGSCRHGIYTKSPLTGCYGESYSGGKLAIAMSHAGYDAIVLTGAADAPLWLEISDSAVRFHDAADLWGRETYATEDEVKRRTGVSGAGVIVIGPAGEKRVRFAVVENDYWRSAGRTGMGAVLGSKNIKALAFHGSARRPFDRPDDIKAYTKNMLQELKHHPATEAYRNLGTPMMVALLNKAGGFPTRYWSKGKSDHWEKINADSMNEQFKVRPRACMNCFMACGKYIEVQEGRHQGLKIEGPEYETLYAFGGLCLLDKIDEIAYMNDICDRLGMDTISAGNLCAFAVEASRRGKIEEKFEYGNPHQIADLLGRIGRREGIGDLLAEGIRPASRELGLEDIAVHVKGMEPAGYDPRALKGMGLAYAVSDRGACHLRSTFYKPELVGMIDPQQIEGKAELFIDFEDRCTLFDCLILCRFYRDFYPWEELSHVIALTTGLELDKPALSAMAARVTDSTRRFNLREGLTREDDRLPKRFLKESLEDGRTVQPEEIDTLVDDYYRLRGWDEQGVPKEQE